VGLCGWGRWNAGLYLNFQPTELPAISSNNLLFGLKSRISRFRRAQRVVGKSLLCRKVKFSAQFVAAAFVCLGLRNEFYNLSREFFQFFQP